MSGRPHVHHFKQATLPRAVDGHVHKIDRKTPFVGDLPCRQSGGDIFGDACDDIVRMTITMTVFIQNGRIRRTTRTTPSARRHAMPRHA
ncbi:hypothetical protein [uncultured Bifidobacterium sp.]|uniref:hypothetical protein n=1 Tax=uncultured Bifidobacterium sp. TaxID=165187 RepID=UPI0025887DCB|nr:hypothetical protein [uncultured Bifidobacterium sp.]